MSIQLLTKLMIIFHKFHVALEWALTNTISNTAENSIARNNQFYKNSVIFVLSSECCVKMGGGKYYIKERLSFKYLNI